MNIRSRNREGALTAINANEFLPFGGRQAYAHSDIRSFTDYVGGCIDTLLDYEPATTNEDFFYISSGVEINRLRISASVSSPSGYKVKSGQGFYFMFPMHGFASVVSDGIKGISQSGETAYFSPEIERAGSTSGLSMIQMSVEEDRLTLTARGMLGERDFNRFKKSLGRPQILSAPNSKAKYQAIIENLCKMIDSADQNPEVLEFMSVDDLFYRTLVLMINGNSISDNRINPDIAYARTIAHRAAEYISANYNRRITRTELEEITGVSYRYIANFFRNNFGCSPLQWLAVQRLELLKLRLEHPDENATVKRLAYACGFINLGNLGMIYTRKYGETPYETLKRARNVKEQRPR